MCWHCAPSSVCQFPSEPCGVGVRGEVVRAGVRAVTFPCQQVFRSNQLKCQGLCLIMIESLVLLFAIFIAAFSINSLSAFSAACLCCWNRWSYLCKTASDIHVHSVSQEHGGGAANTHCPGALSAGVMLGMTRRAPMPPAHTQSGAASLLSSLVPPLKHSWSCSIPADTIT